MSTLDLKHLLPYGDTSNDGALQLSFTLPIEPSARAREAATQMVRGWGFYDVKIAHISSVGIGYSFFVVFARTDKSLDFTKVTAPEVLTEKRTYKEIDKLIFSQIKRQVRLVGCRCFSSI